MSKSRLKRSESLDGHACGEIARFVDIATKLDREMVGEELERNDGEDRTDTIGDIRNLDDVVGNSFEFFGAVAAGQSDDWAFARFDLLDVVDVFREDAVIGRDENGREIGTHERDDAVFKLGTRMTFGKEISDLFHFERTFEGDGKIELASEEKHAVNIGIFLGDRFDLIAELENFLDLLRQGLERFDDSAPFRGGKTSHPAKEQTDESENDEL